MSNDTLYVIRLRKYDSYWLSPGGGITRNLQEACLYTADSSEVLRARESDTRDPLRAERDKTTGRIRLLPVVALSKKHKQQLRQSRKPAPLSCLSPGCYNVIRHMKDNGGITAIDAMTTYQMTSATLARRICDLEELGYEIKRHRKVHPVTGRRYTKYALAC